MFWRRIRVPEHPPLPAEVERDEALAQLATIRIIVVQAERNRHAHPDLADLVNRLKAALLVVPPAGGRDA